MTKMAWVFFNGQFLPEDKAFIPVTDRGFLFGDGVFTTIRLSDGYLECWLDHLKRLEDSCQKINLLCPSIQLDWIKELVHLNQAFQGIWRLKIILTGGSSAQLSLPKNREGQLLITLKQVISHSFHPCRLCVYPRVIETSLSSIKSLAYLERLMIANYAAEQDCEEALVLSSNRQPLETSFSNLIWFYQDCLWFPHPNLSYFSGIFLNAVIKKLPYKHCFFESSLEDIPARAHLYLCNTLHHLRPVIEIQGKQWERNEELESKLKKQIHNFSPHFICN